MIKAVIFDFFGVICSDEYWNFVKEDQNIGGEFSLLSDELNSGQLSWQDFIDKVAAQTGTDAQTIKQMYTSERINPQMVAFIDNLHNSYKTALLTNAHYDQIQPMIDRAHLDTIFDEIIISSVLGYAKPDPKIFEHTLSKLGVQANEAVFIDDLSRYTQAASTLGIHSIQYLNYEQMKKDLSTITDY